MNRIGMQKQQKRLVKFSLIFESDKKIDLIEDWIKTQLNVLEAKGILENYELVRRIVGQSQRNW